MNALLWVSVGTLFGSFVSFCICFYVWLKRGIAESEGRDE